MWVQPREHKIVGACLADARRQENLTQQELAKRLGKPQSFVSDYERGQRRIDLMELLLIARALSADPREIFNAIVNAASGDGDLITRFRRCQERYCVGNIVGPPRPPHHRALAQIAHARLELFLASAGARHHSRHRGSRATGFRV